MNQSEFDSISQKYWILEFSSRYRPGIDIRYLDCYILRAYLKFDSKYILSDLCSMQLRHHQLLGIFLLIWDSIRATIVCFGIIQMQTASHQSTIHIQLVTLVVRKMDFVNLRDNLPLLIAESSIFHLIIAHIIL